MDIEDISVRLSGGAGNTDQHLSLGGVISATNLISGLNSLFEDNSYVDAYVGIDHYRCLYLKNESTVDTTVDLRVWVDKPLNTNTSNRMYMGPDPSGINGIATTISIETEIPYGVSFDLYDSEGSSYKPTVLTPGDHIAIWFKRDFILRSRVTATPDEVSLNLSVLA